MPAPKKPNTEAATKAAAEANRRRALERMAGQLREAGWTVIPPRQPTHDQLPAPRSHTERKPHVVADNLDNLTGPTTGTITLPHHIDWSGTPTKNLDEPGMLASVYQTILNEAATVEDLNTLLNGPALIDLWPTMWLPVAVRRLWETRFPQLRPPHPDA